MIPSGEVCAPALYTGRVMHQRMKPKTHRFSYDVFSCLLDLDRLDEAHRASRIFSVGRFNILSFRQRDHGAGTPDGLADHVRGLLRSHGIGGAERRILLLAYPRVLGYVFNPLSVYYCFSENGGLAALIYEVSNTFGERHSYVIPVDPNSEPSVVSQACDKHFYVSPFLEMALHYRFRLNAPGEHLRLRILEADAKGPIFAAAFSARRERFATGPLLRAFFQLPLMTVKVITAIHWEALRLWLKGVKLVPKEPHTPPVAAERLPRGVI